MKKLDLEELEYEGLKVKYEIISDNDIKIFFSGTIYMLNPNEIITPYLKKLHNEIRNKKFENIFLDFTKLELLNTSGLKIIIKWIKFINLLSKDEKYNIKIIYLEDSDWQYSSIGSLKNIFPELIQ